jgi:hypothetical protein
VVDVRYASNTEDRKCCECNSWIEHWIKCADRIPIYCRVCWRELQPIDITGVHVQKLFSDEGLFIVPMCYECRNKKEKLPDFDVESMDLIKENECGPVKINKNR